MNNPQGESAEATKTIDLVIESAFNNIETLRIISGRLGRISVRVHGESVPVPSLSDNAALQVEVAATGVLPQLQKINIDTADCISIMSSILTAIEETI